MTRAPIYVTKPELPPIDELIPYLEQIWANGILTNSGPLHQKFESELATALGVKHLSLFANGTVALITAIQALDLSGEVITTPFSFVATANAIRWNSLTPVFVDVDRRTLNLDPRQLEGAINPRTSAVLPVHCYGHPCDVHAVEEVATRYGLRVLYDAAHAFGVEIDGRSILNFGDCSVLSFHATKVLNTFEGGAVVSRDASIKARVDQLRNFGIIDSVSVAVAGMNGKMSELNAAVGLLQLKRVSAHLQRRRDIDALYRELLADIPGVRCIGKSGEDVANAAYFPIVLDEAYPVRRDELADRLVSNGVIARKYFYPLISEFQAFRDLPSADSRLLPNAAAAAANVLCLPIYPMLSNDEVEYVAGLVAARN